MKNEFPREKWILLALRAEAEQVGNNAWSEYERETYILSDIKYAAYKIKSFLEETQEIHPELREKLLFHAREYSELSHESQEYKARAISAFMGQVCTTIDNTGLFFNKELNLEDKSIEKVNHNQLIIYLSDTLVELYKDVIPVNNRYPIVSISMITINIYINGLLELNQNYKIKINHSINHLAKNSLKKIVEGYKVLELYSQELFVIILPLINKDNAIEIGNKLKEAVLNYFWETINPEFPLVEPNLSVSIKLRITQYEDELIEQWVSRSIS